MRCDNVDQKILGNFSVREIDQIFSKVREYNGGGWRYNYPDHIASKLSVHVSTETDGHPYEITTTVIRYPNSDKRYDSEIWKVTVGYEATSGEEYDLIETVRADRSTAYKTRSAGPPHDVKFKLINYWLYEQSNEALEIAQSELSYLKKLYSYLDENTKTIEAWAKSGLDMAVLCKGSRCTKPAVALSNNRLSSFVGVVATLADLEKRLTCTHCGARNPRLRPLPNDRMGVVL